MDTCEPQSRPDSQTANPPPPFVNSAAVRRFLIFAVLLAASFLGPFRGLVRFALDEDLFSYVLLVPFISLYLAWVRREGLARAPAGARWPAVITAAAGLGLLAAAWRGGEALAPATLLAAQMLSFCCLLWSGGFALLGSRTMRALAFPALFLVFMAPIPPSIVGMLETGLQHASADLSYRLIVLAGIPVFRSGVDFHMPGIAFSIAQECSGIRSTLVLFMCSLVAGHLFLRTAWRRWVFALLVIPLGIARNAVRILTLAWLCVRVDPSYIHSPLHRSGGPLFFALSLIPFGLVLLWFWHAERKSRRE